MNTPKILVWDLPTRLFHWLLAGSFAVAYITAEVEGWENVHFTAGFTLLGLIVFRVVWGLLGSRYARFSEFAYKPGQVLDYVRNIKSRHHLGHNPLGSMAVFGLLGLGLLTALTGWLMYLSGSELLEEPHELAANAMLALVCLHVAGVVISSKLHGENLSRAMATGQKKGNPQDAIRSAHPLVAAILLVSVLGFWGYSWMHPFENAAMGESEKAGEHAEGDDDDD
jgi:cytochrome b